MYSYRYSYNIAGICAGVFSLEKARNIKNRYVSFSWGVGLFLWLCNEVSCIMTSYNCLFVRFLCRKWS